jgi:hypothetical protein
MKMECAYIGSNLQNSHVTVYKTVKSIYIQFFCVQFPSQKRLVAAILSNIKPGLYPSTVRLIESVSSPLHVQLRLKCLVRRTL